MADNLIRKGAVTASLVSAGIARPRIVGAGGTPPFEPEPWARPYIGIRWRELGRERDGGVDCWGLVRLPLLEVFKCETPPFDIGYTGCNREDVRDINLLIIRNAIDWVLVAAAHRPDGLTPLGEERSGDLLLIRQHGAASHIAMVAGGGHMLHIEEGVDSSCEPYIDGQWRRRIVGIYRHPGLVHP